MKKALIAGLILFLFIVASPMETLAAEATAKMTIGAGQSRTVTLYGLQRAAIANPDVADVVVVSSSEADRLHYFDCLVGVRPPKLLGGSVGG